MREPCGTPRFGRNVFYRINIINGSIEVVNHYRSDTRYRPCYRYIRAWSWGLIVYYVKLVRLSNSDREARPAYHALQSKSGSSAKDDWSVKSQYIVC
ncbi:hypothetical protein Barb4_05103 [Bacteroidales bacterium Barb4]|nr:hypothetical protein Barb4_05103 [Bacteroidales bacterium Barb4]